MVYVCKSFRICEHKVFELQISRWKDEDRWFGFDTWIRRKGVDDHSGITIDVTLFGVEFSVALYDTRHKEDVI